jgi:hypothetical protein
LNKTSAVDRVSNPFDYLFFRNRVIGKNLFDIVRTGGVFVSSASEVIPVSTKKTSSGDSKRINSAVVFAVTRLAATSVLA